ncbi:hypothetical protein ACTDI4_15065 [Mesorhizobium sp. PUT5]|uniref:hypothetical protein n=1 Tax=Mesorhizobium sp. PUT5 TaxID=3454629 RepID=UPI003FA4BAB9
MEELMPGKPTTLLDQMSGKVPAGPQRKSMGARVERPTAEMKESAATIGLRKPKQPLRMTKTEAQTSKPSRAEYLGLIAEAYAGAILRWDELGAGTKAPNKRAGDAINAELESRISYGDRRNKSRDKQAIMYLWSEKILPGDVEALSRNAGHGLDTWARAGAVQRPFIKDLGKSPIPTPSVTGHIIEIRPQLGGRGQQWIIRHGPWVDDLIRELTRRAKNHPTLVSKWDDRTASTGWR